MPQGGPQEIVIRLDSEHAPVQAMPMSDFELLVSGEACLPECAATSTQAVYCVVGHGLNIAAAVFFSLKINVLRYVLL